MLTDEFRKELEQLISRYSLESGSQTPDFILAKYLEDCLRAFDSAVTRRTAWWTDDTTEKALTSPKEHVRTHRTTGEVDVNALSDVVENTPSSKTGYRW